MSVEEDIHDSKSPPDQEFAHSIVILLISSCCKDGSHPPSYWKHISMSLQGEHLVVKVIAKVFSVTKLRKMIKNNSTTNYRGFNAGYNEYLVQLKKIGGHRFLHMFFFRCFP